MQATSKKHTWPRSNGISGLRFKFSISFKCQITCVVCFFSPATRESAKVLFLSAWKVDPVETPNNSPFSSLLYFAAGAFYSLPLFCQSCERVIVKRRRTIFALTHSIYSWELSDLGSAAAKIPERSLFNRLFGQYLDIDAADPAKSVLVQLFFSLSPPSVRQAPSKRTYYESRRATPFLHFRQSFSS